MVSNESRRAATQARLIESARTLFAQDGYDTTHTDSILELAGVSRGALYHHFATKRDLFEAVFVAVVDQTVEPAALRVRHSDSPLADLAEGCIRWLRAVRKPAVATILLDQGPQVLGWKRAREIEGSRSLPLMKKSLQSAQAAGEIQIDSLELTALMLNALLAEAALAGLYRRGKIRAADQESAVRQFVEGLRVRK